MLSLSTSAARKRFRLVTTTPARLSLAEPCDAGGARLGQSAVPSDLGSAVAIAAGGYHTCALEADGAVRCWGDNDDGQTDVPSDLDSALAISAGRYHTCAIDAEGSVRCWGDNDDGQSDVPPFTLRAGYRVAPFGYVSTGEYTFERICSADQTYQVAKPEGGNQHTPLKLGCWTDAGSYVITCGDGFVASSEGCDDGNTESGDGCSALCQLETRCGSDFYLGSVLGQPAASGSTTDAGNDFTGYGGAASDIAYTWAAPTSGSFTFDTIGSEFDTRLELLDASCGQLARNDDGGGDRTSLITLDLDAGTQVVIVVDGYGTNAGNFVLNITEN